MKQVFDLIEGGFNFEKFKMITFYKILFILCAFSLIYKCYTSIVPTIVSIIDPKFSVLGPYNTTEIFVEDNYRQLIDIKNFSFKINPNPCKNYPAGLLLIVMVSSKPDNYDKREAIRQTWGRNIDSMKLVFLMGDPVNTTITNQIVVENSKFGDIVQGNFVDVYRNLTYKHVMGLKWVSHHCANAKYVLKIDDDVLVNVHVLRHFLARELSPWGATDLITCAVLEHTLVQRSEKAKWKVTTDEYASKYYPNYCAGWAILYSQDVVPRLLSIAQTLPYFWIDDVHITGIIAEKIGIPITTLSSMILSGSKLKILNILGPKFVTPFIFGPPDLSPSKIVEIWKIIRE